MERKTRIITIALFLLTTISLSAQNTHALKEKLATPDITGGARIEVKEMGDAASIIKMQESYRKNTTVSGYRVRIFFDNTQNARISAQATKRRFEEMFPNTPTYLDYENPYFKVSAGNCLTIDEAIILWGNVKGAFDKAFVIREEIKLSALTEDE